MGLRKRTNENRSARLVVKRETLRALQTLSDDQMRLARGGWPIGGGTSENCLPSCRGC